MPTNRPFFSSFLAAFRAHSALKSASASSSVSTSANGLASQSSHLTQTTSQNAAMQTASTSHGIASKASTTLSAATTAAVAAFSPPSTAHHHARHSSTTPASRTPSTPLSGSFGNTNRRGSDSSSDGGFRETKGAEKWFIGGRTAQGEERYYRLGMARRERSEDRTSCDRMSL